MSFQKRSFLLAFLFSILTPVLLPAQPMRLALLVDMPELQPTGDLLTAQLSARPDLVLLERVQIQKIMQEQQITAVNPGNALKLGQMLGADGLLLLNLGQENDHKFLYTRLLAVKPGVILRTTASSWPLPSVAEWPAVVARQFDPLFPKLAVLAKDAVPISILNLRSAVKSIEAERLEKELTLLLIDRLSREKEVFVLERQRMALLESEKELKGMEDTPFWNGSYLLEGIVDKGGFSPDTVTISARLTSPDKRSANLEVKGARQNLPQTAEALARQVLGHFKNLTPGAAWNPHAEATQYLDEARWAMRWKVYAQAQWAADSAWALGNHELETARLRVQSFSDPAIIRSNYSEPDGNSMTVQRVDGVYPQYLEGLAIALDNFCSSTPFLRTNAADKAWIDAGLSALNVAAAHLWRYWFTPTAVPGAAEKLSRLREAARNAERALLGEEPTPRTYETPVGKRLWQLKMERGWIYNERPREILLDYRRLLAHGFNEEQRRELRNRGPGSPRLVGWSPQERAEIPELWERFLQEQITSTNVLTSLEGRLWRYRSMPLSELMAGPEGECNDPATPIYAAVEQHQAELLCRHNRLLVDALETAEGRYLGPWKPRKSAALFNSGRRCRTNLVQLLVHRGDCLDDDLVQRAFRVPDFETNHLTALVEQITARSGTNVTWRKVFLHAYLWGYFRSMGTGLALIEKGHYCDVMFTLLHPEDYTPEEGQKLLRDLRRFRADQEVRGDPIAKPIAEMETYLAKARVRQVPIPMPAVAKIGTNVQPLLISRYWEAPTNSTKTSYTSDLRLLHALYRDQRLWFQAQYKYHYLVTNVSSSLDVSIFPKEDISGCFYSVDLKDFSYTQQGYPVDRPTRASMMWFDVPRNFEVLNNTLYRSAESKLLTATINDTNWHEVNLPVPAQMLIFKVKDRLCLRSPDSLLELDPAQGTTRVIASARRRPPVNELDKLGSFDRALFFDGGSNAIQVLFRNAVWPWNTATGELGQPTPPLVSGYSSVAYADEKQVLLATGERDRPRVSRVLYRLAQGRPLEALLSLGAQRLMASMRPAKVEVTKWHPTDQQKGAFGVAVPDGENMWSLRYSFIGDKPVLLYFDERWSEPLMIPVKFDRANPFPGAPGPSPIPNLELLATPQGLVIFPKLCPGFWFIPRADLEKAIATGK